MIHSTKRLLWLLLLIPGLSYAQPSEILSLPEIIQRIEDNNLLLQSYGLRADNYRYRAEAATAWMAPMVGVGTFMTPYPGQMMMEARDRGMLMFRVEQQFPNPSRQRAERRYIESQGDAERTARAVALNNLKAQARSSYYAWLVSAQKIRVLEKNEEVLQMMKKIEEVRYPYNQSPLSGIYRAEAEIERNHNMITMQVGDIQRAEASLNALMNRSGSIEFQIDTAYQPRFVPVASIDTSLLATQRSDIIRMNQQIRSMQLNIEAMQLQRKPDFRIQFDHMAPLSRMPQMFSLMGMMTIPFASWSSRMYKSDTKAMELSIRAMEKERAAMLQETQGMLYAMQAEIRAMQARLTSMETKVIPALQRAFDANFLVYQENKLSLTVLLETWEALNMMRMDLLDERGKLYQMIVDYEKELYR
ncbi:TolC family protein [Telluribacter sp.]|jgi:outer membrane protein TolC|uniref:TolC family protein n=1 Tax=Telluribacter sp. TaxID=1978767 RepID=UPI002E15FAF0|nr:TolC family protein [Telluribacter sp.]